jgi:hypothetical protein
MFDFTALPRPKTYPRPTYAGTVSLYRTGLLSLGFLWELARHDEVFGAYLRRAGIPRLAKDETGRIAQEQGR